MVRFVLLAALIAGCSGGDSSDTSDSSDTAVVHFDDTYALFGDRCTGCHYEGPDAQGALDLSSQQAAYAALVGVAAAGPMCADPPHVRVVPGDVDGSLLYAKLAMTMDCGLGMPEHEGPGPPGNTSPFTADELAVVAAWIEAGAAE